MANPPPRLPWERAIVTGASAGIGKAIAADLAGGGVDLVLVARNEAQLTEQAAELERLHGVGVEVLPTDLATQAGRDAVGARVGAEPTVDLLVNNAGVSTFGAFAGTDMDSELRTVSVNLLAPFELTRAFLDAGTRPGTVLTISSMDALQPGPYHAVYAATKAFVNSFFEALHEESRGSGVTFTTVMPGYVATEFANRAGLEGALDDVPSLLLLSPEKVARDALAGAAAGRAMVVPGRIYQVSAALLSAAPTRVGRRVFSHLAPGRDR